MIGKQWEHVDLLTGNRLHHCGKPQFLMGKLPISMAMYNSYVELPEGSSEDTSYRIPWGCFNLEFLDTMRISIMMATNDHNIRTKKQTSEMSASWRESSTIWV